MFDLITFLSDFGWQGGYVAACEAILFRVHPGARVLHISHEVAVGNISDGATVLERVAPLCPLAVHLAIIDPGVGTPRRPLLLQTARGDYLVGPDNGLLLPAVRALGGIAVAWMLDPVKTRARAGLPATEISFTFHGRDVFAPAAALVASGVKPEEIAQPVDAASLHEGPALLAEVTPEGARAQVLEIDRFGNVGLALCYDELRPDDQAGPVSHYLVEAEGENLPGWEARVVQTFAQLLPGELGIYRDSWGQVALALNGASAAELLSVERGMTIRLTAARHQPL